MVGRVWTALSGVIGAVVGLAPHVLHHIGPIAGAALVSGAGGTTFFAIIGFVLTIPMLLSLRRRFDNWLAPAIALGLFAVMFTVSTLWIGPAIRGDNDNSEPADHEEHHSIARVLVSA
jgi:hypothetical protein